MRDNLFAPWFLANLCAKFGIHFTYVGTGRLFEYDADHKIDGLKYSVTKFNVYKTLIGK